MMDGLEVAVGGTSLTLLPERAAFRRDCRTLLVADAHFGKAAAFRTGGVPVPGGTTHDGIARLDALIERTAARRVVFLGDFLHAAEGRTPGTLRQLAEWRARHADLEMMLVRGNHDRSAGDPPDELDIGCIDEPFVEAPLVLAHYPRPSPLGFVVAGHLHPGVRLIGSGRQRARLPCFWFTDSVATLPAFGDFTGLATIEPAAGDRVIVIADGELLDLSRAR
jgi:uncharacterized protein